MAKYVWYRVINNNIVVLKDDLGRIHYCSTCPCVHDQYKLFVDLIQIQPLFNGHPADNMPNRPGEYDIEITFNYFRKAYANSHNLKPYTYTFPQFDYFQQNSTIYQQTVPVNVAREAKIDLYKQTSNLIRQKIVSGDTLGDYSDVWHWNKFGDSTANYLSTSLTIPDTSQFYQYLSSITFNNVDYDLDMNVDHSLQRQQFAVASAADVSFNFYYDQNDSNGFKPYTRKMYDNKQYFATRVISADSTAYCYSTDQPDDVWDISDIAVLYQTIGGTLNKPQAGNYVYIGTVNGYQMGLIKIDEKYYYYDKEYRLVKQYKDSVASCVIVPSAYVNQYYPNSKFYTGFAFEYNNQVKYIYSKPSKLSIQSYSYGYLYPDTQQIEIRSSYYTEYDGDLHPLEFDSTSGWYFATYYDSSDPQDNRYVYLNDFTEESPPLYWQKDGETYYTHTGPYYISDETYNQVTEVLTGNQFYVADQSYFYQLKYDSTTSSWYYITNLNYPVEYRYQLTGGTPTEPPPYNIFDNDTIIKTGQANWWKHKDDNSIHLSIDAYYDIRFGDLINTYSPAPYYGNQFTDGNRIMQNVKYLNRQMSPLIKYQKIHYEWEASNLPTSLTVGQFLTSTYLQDKSINSGFIRSYNSSAGDPDAIQYGLDEGYNDNIGITTFRLNKPTAAELQSNWSSYYDNRMSSILDELCGVYCQILTGVFIKPNSDSPTINNRDIQYQFRANGTFYQTLQFGQDYMFCPYFLQSEDVIDVLSTQDGWDDFLTNLKGLNNYYNNFENNFYATTNYQKFLDSSSGVVSFMACYFIRPISGVTELDGSQQEHLAPSALTSQQAN